MQNKKIKLDREQARNLREAIKEWVILDPKEDFDYPHCVLCDEYQHRSLEGGPECCYRCPVWLYTGKTLCRKTPNTRSYRSTASERKYTIQFGNKILEAAGLKPVKG